MLVNRSVFPDD